MTPKRKRIAINTDTDERKSFNTWQAIKPIGPISQGIPKRTKATSSSSSSQSTASRTVDTRAASDPSSSWGSIGGWYAKVLNHAIYICLIDFLNNSYPMPLIMLIRLFNFSIRRRNSIAFVSMTEITNHLYYKDLQRQLWNQYADISSKDDHWESTIAKAYARQHHTSRMYRPKKSFIEQRRKRIDEQIKKLCEELDKNLDQLKGKIARWQPVIDFCRPVNDHRRMCKKKVKQRLRNLFDFKKTMIKLAWQDHSCLNQFYQATPNADVIHLAKTNLGSNSTGIEN